MSAATGYDAAGFDESATYWYNGAKRTARSFTADQEEARLLVREFVRVLLEGRERHELEYEGPWDPNVAVANCYRGSKQASPTSGPSDSPLFPSDLRRPPVGRLSQRCASVPRTVPDHCLPHARLHATLPPPPVPPFRRQHLRRLGLAAPDPDTRHHPAAQLALDHACRVSGAVQACCAAYERDGCVQAAEVEP